MEYRRGGPSVPLNLRVVRVLWGYRRVKGLLGVE